MESKKLSQFLSHKTVVVILAVLFTYFLLKWVGLFFVKKTLEKEWAKVVPVQLEIGSLSYSILGRSGTINNITIHDQGTPIFKVKQATTSISLLSLLQNEKVVRSIFVNKPHLYFQTDGKKNNVAKLFKMKLPKSRDIAGKKEKPPAFLIKNISVRNFALSYIKKFDESTFTYVIDRGKINIKNFSYPKLRKTPIDIKMRFPKRAPASLMGLLSPDKKNKFKFNGEYTMDKLSIVALKNYMQHHYGMIPKRGTASLNSKISLKGTHLKSTHELTVNNLAVEGGAGIVGVALGSGSEIVTKFLNRLEQNEFKLTFEVNGDLANPNKKWVAGLGRSIASAFTIQLIERAPADAIKESTEKALKTIEGIIP